MDKNTLQNRGFGFVTFSQSESARTMLSFASDRPFVGYIVKVDVNRKKDRKNIPVLNLPAARVIFGEFSLEELRFLPQREPHVFPTEDIKFKIDKDRRRFFIFSE